MTKVNGIERKVTAKFGSPKNDSPEVLPDNAPKNSASAHLLFKQQERKKPVVKTKKRDENADPLDGLSGLELSVKRYDDNRKKDGLNKWKPEKNLPVTAYKPKIRPYMSKKMEKLGKFTADSKYIEYTQYLKRE